MDDLLREGIDQKERVKAVRETALANAKIALEEAFTHAYNLCYQKNSIRNGRQGRRRSRMER